MNKNLKTLLLISVLLVSTLMLSACNSQEDLKGDIMKDSKTTKEMTKIEKEVVNKIEVVEEENLNTTIKTVTDENSIIGVGDGYEHDCDAHGDCANGYTCKLGTCAKEDIK